MVIQNPLLLKDKIISFLQRRGPSLPIPIAKDVQLSTLFASAFLSELASEKRIRISKMKVGGSPLYFIPGQENMLENFSNYLKSKEKEAFLLLKENKFLKDSEQDPAIRVALREITDFTFPFKSNEELFWRYLTASESEFQETEKKIEKVTEEPAKKIQEEIIIEPVEKSEEVRVLTTPLIKEKPLDIFEKKKESKNKEKKKSKKQPKKASKKQEESFFNKIKENLNKKSIEIVDIIGISKNEIILKVKEEKEYILFALNTKKINEKEIIKAYKKSKEYDLEYKIFFLGEVPKRIDDFIVSVKSLQSIEKIE